MISIGVLVAIGLIGAIALQIAIARNGPAVLSAVDWLTGGSRGATQLAQISTGEHPQQKLIVWGEADRDPNAASRPVLVFTHGGSWRTGDPSDYGFVGRAFVAEGFVVVLAGYRLMPDGPYPAMLEDTASAIAWTHANIAQFGGDPQRIVTAGHSAGAYNVVMTALDKRWLSAYGAAAEPVAGVVGMSGPYDFLPLARESTKAAFGAAEDLPATQPASHLGDDAPPMLFIHGEKDKLVGLHNSERLTGRLNQAGASAQLITYPDMAHNDPLLSLASPWRGGRNVVTQIAEFVRRVTKTSSETSSDTLSVSVQTDAR